MSANLRWLLPSKKILLVTIPEHWDWSEMRSWLKEIIRMLNQVSEPRTLIFDFQHSTHLPPYTTLNTQALLRHIHPMAKPIIFARVSHVHRASLEMMFRLNPTATRQFIIIDELNHLV